MQYLLFTLSLLLLAGCYQTDSEIGLRTVPTTNNRNVIMVDVERNVPGANF